MIFISKYLEITDLEEHGVFDALIDKDSNFFINILRLKETEVPEFSSSYDTINNFFSGIASLLAAAKSKNSSDKFFRTALRKFDFKEVNGINLGFSESKNGSGIGQKLRLQILKDAFDIIKQGSTQPEIFQLVGLFEEGIGPDRLSDMIATIIKKDIIAYTKRIQKDYNIDQKHFPDKKFLSNGVIYNPIKKCPLYFVPSDILHELPIAKSWEDIDNVVDKNQCIRDEINEAIGEEWSKWATRQKKEYIREKIFKNPDKCSRVVETYKMATAESFNPYNDLEYTIAKISDKIYELISYLKCEQEKLKSSFAVSTNIVNLFKDWVENNQGWKIIQEMDSRKREKFLQRIIHLAGLSFVKSNNLDFSCEPDEGRGPVDFKISRGLDKTIIEVKLSSNQQYLHGYEVQVGEYGKAENTDQMIYVLIDLGNPVRIKKLKETHNKNIKEQIKAPELIIINGTEKTSASIYDDNDSFNLDIADFDISEIETIFDGIDVFDFDNIIDLKDTDC